MKNEKDIYQDALVLMWLLLHEKDRKEKEQCEGTVIKGVCKDDK